MFQHAKVRDSVYPVSVKKNDASVRSNQSVSENRDNVTFFIHARCLRLKQ